MRTERVEQAVERKRSGFNCCQSVLLTYADEIGLPEPLLAKLAAGFAGGRTIWWHQHTDVYAGDEVYIYYGRPYSAIMFRCKVLAASVPPERTGLDPSELRPEHRKFMELALLESYPPDRFPLPFLRAHGGSVCRSARRMPAELLAAIRS